MNAVHTFVLVSSCLAAVSIESEVTLTLSPSGAALVCPGGELVIVCSTNRSFIRWNVTILQSEENVIRSRLVSSDDRSMGPLVVTKKSFNITLKNSSIHELTSILSVANVTTDLNGTRVRCTDIGSSLAETSTSAAIIHVINATNTVPHAPEVTRSGKDVYGIENITVSFEWTQEDHLSYNVTIIPQVHIRFRRSTSVEVTVTYNTSYNVSVIPSLCSERGAATSFYLNFVKCQDLLMIFNDPLNITGYSQPALVGSNATFSCPLGLEQTGPKSSTCMENGEWEPDPREVECKANCGLPSPPPNGVIFPYASVLEGANITIACLTDGVEEIQFCTRHGIWEPNSDEMCGSRLVSGNTNAQGVIVAISLAISFTVLFLTSLLLIIIMIVCCWCKRKQKHTTSEAHLTNVIYEEVQPRSQEQDLELKQNVAYGPIRSHLL